MNIYIICLNTNVKKNKSTNAKKKMRFNSILKSANLLRCNMVTEDVLNVF